MMVAGKIALEIVKLGARSLVKYSGKEKAFWTRRYGDIGGRAVRHGLAVGPGVGSFLSTGSDINDDASLSVKNGSSPYTEDKTRSRQFSYSNRSRKLRKYNYSRNRCSCARKHYRSRYR